MPTHNRSGYARAERSRLLQAERDARRWGGSPPSDRLRRLPGQARSLARVDRALLDRLEALPGERQREIACWAARRALRVAGPERIAWVSGALADAEAGRALPVAVTEQGGAPAFQRSPSDPEVPHTTVPYRHGAGSSGASGVSRILRQAVAFPALLALANDDPLAAVVDAVDNAVLSYGDEDGRFLTEAHELAG
jgi:hypothetical protein